MPNSESSVARSESGPISEASHPRSAISRRFWTGSITLVLSVATIAGLVVLPFPISHTYEFSIAPCGGGSEARQFEDMAEVEVHWGVSQGGSVSFVIREGNQSLYDQTSSEGTYSFTSSGQPVSFDAISEGLDCSGADVGVYGNWVGPLL